MQNYSLVPSLINENKIRLFDDNGVTINICDPVLIKSFPKYKSPYLVIDSFGKQVTREITLKDISVEELESKGLYLVKIDKISTSAKWRSNMRVMYRIERKGNTSPGAKPISYVPTDHFLKIDTANNRVVLLGPNAGYPHTNYMYKGVNRGRGDWVQVIEKDGK